MAVGLQGSTKASVDQTANKQHSENATSLLQLLAGKTAWEMNRRQSIVMGISAVQVESYQYLD